MLNNSFPNARIFYKHTLGGSVFYKQVNTHLVFPKFTYKILSYIFVFNTVWRIVFFVQSFGVERKL